MDALKTMADQGWAIRQRHFGSTICFSYPSQTRSISVTGDKCQMNCAHCGGHYLKNMKALEDESNWGNSFVSSFLISGGCNLDGKVPIRDHVERLAMLKQGKRCNVHVGLVQEDDITEIAKIADTISFDMIGDDETIREVLGAGHTVADYAESYKKLRDKCTVVPHICIGLHGGEIRGEYRAMELLKTLGIDELSFIVFRPTKGTRFSLCQPPDLIAAAKILAASRQEFPDIPIHLGCMRPGGSYRHELDAWAVRSGINTIVNPTPVTVQLAKSLNLSITIKKECCVL